jgi:hypothetical protein
MPVLSLLQVAPPLRVNQTPPDDTPTRTVLESRGSTQIECIPGRSAKNRDVFADVGLIIENITAGRRMDRERRVEHFAQRATRNIDRRAFDLPLHRWREHDAGYGPLGSLKR